MKFHYFPLMARGLSLVLVIEVGGLNEQIVSSAIQFSEWKDIKPSTPFGQLPILVREDGSMIAQSAAIANVISDKHAGLRGSNDKDFAMSQTLISEAEDLYTLLQRYQPTIYVKQKETPEVFWKTVCPDHLKRLESLIGESKAFTTSNFTCGELYLFGMVHQMVLVQSACLADFPGVSGWYETVLAHPAVQMVLKGESSIGPLAQYFRDPDNASEKTAAA